MESYIVQITTELGEVINLEIYANSPGMAESIAISMVESGDAPCEGLSVVDCFAIY